MAGTYALSIVTLTVSAVDAGGVTVSKDWIHFANNTSRLRIAWTILKLKVTRAVLAVLLRIHVRHELKKRDKDVM